MRWPAEVAPTRLSALIPACKHGHRIASPQDSHQPAAMAQAVALQAVAPASRSSAVSAAPALLSHSLGDAAAADRTAAPLVQARPFSSVRPAPLRAARAEARQAIVCAGALPWPAERG